MKKRMELPEKVRRQFAAIGRKNGHLGGKAAAANMTPEQLTARAKKASDAATAKRKARKDPA